MVGVENTWKLHTLIVVNLIDRVHWYKSIYSHYVLFNLIYFLTLTTKINCLFTYTQQKPILGQCTTTQLATLFIFSLLIIASVKVITITSLCNSYSYKYSYL